MVTEPQAGNMLRLSTLNWVLYFIFMCIISLLRLTFAASPHVLWSRWHKSAVRPAESPLCAKAVPDCLSNWRILHCRQAIAVAGSKLQSRLEIPLYLQKLATLRVSELVLSSRRFVGNCSGLLCCWQSKSLSGSKSSRRWWCRALARSSGPYSLCLNCSQAPRGLEWTTIEVNKPDSDRQLLCISARLFTNCTICVCLTLERLPKVSSTN